MDEAIARRLKTAHSLLIGDQTAEQIKIFLGSAYPVGEEKSMQVGGRDLIEGLPRTVEVTSAEVREALAEPVTQIVDRVRGLLEETPPELSADILRRGIWLTGGGALLRGLDQLLAAATGMPVHVAEDPLSCVALGTGLALEAQHAARRGAISGR